MNERTSGLWIVALVAFAGLFHVVLGANPPQSASASLERTETSSQNSSPVLTDDLAIKLLADHYLIDKPTANCSQPKPDACLAAEAVRRFNAEEGKVLIALLPDPLDAHATHRFDETVEALEAGLVSSGLPS
jgi:hypothetical protein